MPTDEWMVVVARRLGELVEQVDFVGGAILGALIDKVATIVAPIFASAIV